VAKVAAALGETGLAPAQLELEITESTIMQNDEVTLGALEKLSEMGVGLSLDDFGTGYSSLSYLRRFPLDRVKIDRSFVGEITRDPDDAALTAAIVAMAHSLRLGVVAEGVETREHLDFLRERRCDEFQGFLVSPAVSATAFSRFLKQDTLA
jgi:EAL domain-containing protein (putative c-di-GMP-specific phosphodiesterase class I)